jgi:hypothetical protein
MSGTVYDCQQCGACCLDPKGGEAYAWHDRAEANRMRRRGLTVVARREKLSWAPGRSLPVAGSASPSGDRPVARANARFTRTAPGFAAGSVWETASASWREWRPACPSKVCPMAAERGFFRDGCSLGPGEIQL